MDQIEVLMHASLPPSPAPSHRDESSEKTAESSSNQRIRSTPNFEISGSPCKSELLEFGKPEFVSARYFKDLKSGSTSKSDQLEFGSTCKADFKKPRSTRKSKRPNFGSARKSNQLESG